MRGITKITVRGSVSWILLLISLLTNLTWLSTYSLIGEVEPRDRMSGQLGERHHRATLSAAGGALQQDRLLDQKAARDAVEVGDACGSLKDLESRSVTEIKKMVKENM